MLFTTALLKRQKYREKKKQKAAQKKEKSDVSIQN